MTYFILRGHTLLLINNFQIKLSWLMRACVNLIFSTGYFQVSIDVSCDLQKCLYSNI